MTNPGFESKLTGWKNNGYTSAITGKSKSGIYSARSGTAAGGLQQTLTNKLVAGNIYKLSFWGKIGTNSVSSMVSLRVKNSSGGIMILENLPVLSTTYTQYSIQFTYPTGATSVDVAGIKEIDIVVTKRGDRLIVEINEKDLDNVELHWRIEMPGVRRTTGNLGVGQIIAEVQNTELRVDLGVGEASVALLGN